MDVMIENFDPAANAFKAQTERLKAVGEAARPVGRS
jgi:hypothetical protein